MRLFTPNSLHYPITVTRLRCQPGTDVSEGDPLFDYRYETKVIEGTEEKPEGVEVVRPFYATFESEVAGKLENVLVQQGAVITKSRTPVVDIEEPCLHEVQFHGVCASCGKDMTEVRYNTVMKDTDRATIQFAHTQQGLLISAAEASRSDEQAKRTLVASRKLSLVVDLDQTVIQTTVDNTVAEWKNDPGNPNHEAVKDVHAFQLLDESPGGRGTWYYVKLRPGTKEFLHDMAKLYELHIYTMATKNYAKNIAAIIDPEGKLFGDRILSRDESGSMTIKSLQRLFPVDTRMVVIIDDRGDVWHWSQNLVKVSPYEFFVGIGDINSSFLPKRPGFDNSDAPAAPAGDTADTASSNGTALTTKVVRPVGTPVEPQTNGDVSTIDQLLSMSGDPDGHKLEEQTHEHDETIAAQIADRPLLQKQRMLDAAEEAGAISNETSASQQNGQSPSPAHRHNLLRDDDDELHYLRQSLTRVHAAFYDTYDSRVSAGNPAPSRVSDLKQDATKPRAPTSPVASLSLLPDVTTIMSGMKTSVLRNVSIVFSGVLPLGTPIQSHDLAVWAKSFGAQVTENITRRTTHLIASPARRTAKVRQAWRRSNVRIVSTRWLLDCLIRWTRVDETDYQIHLEMEDEAHPPTGPGNLTPGEQGPGLLSSSDDEAAMTEDEEGLPFRDRTVPRTQTGRETDGDDTETETELRRHMPTLPREDSSPTEDKEGDWDDVNDELAEFLGSDDDDDDDGEDSSSSSATASETETEKTTTTTTPTARGKKRKRQPASDRGGDGGDSDLSGAEGESRLERRKKKALGRTSSLNTVEAVAGDRADGADGVDVVDVVAGEKEDGTAVVADDEDDGDGDGDGDDLEAQLAAEMARLSDEEEEQGGG